MMTLKDAARTINVPYETTLWYHKKGLLPTTRIGRYECIEPNVLRAVLDAAGYQRQAKRKAAQ